MDSNREPIDPAEVQFVLTGDGRLGLGYCPDKEQGGFMVLKWAPDGMVRIAAAEILAPKGDR